MTLNRTQILYGALMLTVPLLVALSIFGILSFTQKKSATDLSEEITTYRNSFGLERPINTAITKAYGAYQYKNTNNTYQSYYKNNPLTKNAIRFANGASSINFYTLESQSFGPLSAPAPHIEGSSITYPRVFEQLDLKYTVYPTRLLEEFVANDVNTATKVTEIRQQATVDNIDSYEEKNGSIIFRYRGQTSFIIPPPVLYEQNNTSNNSYGIKYEIKDLGRNNYEISKVITEDGKSWLADPKRQYPIVIDLVIDNADAYASWVSSDVTNLVVSQETTLKQEGSDSLKLQAKGPLGTGADGDCIIDNGTKTLDTTAGSSVCNGSARSTAYAVNFSSTVSTTAGSSTITLSSTPTGLAVGDEVLIINLMGTDAANADVGKYETKYIETISSNTLTLDSPLANGYDGTTQKIMVQRIPNFGNITVCGGNTGGGCTAAATVNTTAFNGTKNGVLFFRSTGTVTINSGGVITTTGLGYRGGAGIADNSTNYGYQGESTSGAGTMTYTVKTAGGGGGGYGHTSTGNYGDGGAGGGYGTTGGNGNNPAALDPGGSQAAGGSTYGVDTLATLFFGSGGGGGGTGTTAGAGSGNGSAGGGIIAITANAITNNGSIVNNGNAGGGATTSAHGGGGGGAGGSIIITANTTTVGTSTITTTGGAAGNGAQASGGNGGAGGSGRIAIYSGSITGTTNPAAYTSSIITSATNDTATLTKAATDLSGSNLISFWVRSNKSGSFITVQFGETNSDEQSNGFTINSVNTWEQKTWDISSIAASARDGVTKFAFKITNDQSSTIYIDNLHTSNLSTPTIGTPEALSPNSIRWNITDNSTGETGFRVYSNNSILDQMEYASDASIQNAYQYVYATGGTVTTSGNYTLHTFTTDGTFTPVSSFLIDYLLVGGGGGGGGGESQNGLGGGGGAGGGGEVKTGTVTTSATSYAVTIGGGGPGGASASGDSSSNGTGGGNTTALGLTAVGGGYGGADWKAGGSGASGGGTGGDNGTAGGTGTAGYNGGNAGGRAGGGGGGSSAIGENGSVDGAGQGGDGGNGTASSISGSEVIYGSGGGGGAGGSAAGTPGGTGGSGAGDGSAAGTNVGTGTYQATSGTANRGGGGGGQGAGNGTSRPGGAGGSGVTIIRYPTSHLVPTRETTIKTQGSSSLKVVADATTSLNQTLNHTLSPTVDLTNQNSITFDIRASRTGNNIKLGLHDSGGTTTEITPNITQADTFQTITWDLSGVSNNVKDAIDQIVVTIVNADAVNTFYIDNLGQTGTGTTTCAAANATYCDETGLSPNTLYTRKVVAYSGNDESNFSEAASKYTLAITPSAPIVTNRTSTTVDVNVDPATNSSITTYAIYKEEGNTCDGSGGSYIAANGSDNGNTPVWQVDGTWNTVTVTGLNGDKSYVFCTKAKNAENVETSFSDVGAHNIGFIPVSGDYIYTNDTVNTSSFTNSRHVDGNDGNRYVLGVDDGGSPNRAQFQVKSGILTINATDTLAVGTLNMTGGSIAIADGGKIEVGKSIWMVDQDADGWGNQRKLYVGNQPTHGRRKNLATHLTAADCNDTKYSTFNYCSLGSAGDGDCIVNNGTKDINSLAGSSFCNGSARATAYGVSFRSTTNTAAGATAITISTTPTGLAAGDEVLIINLQGTTSNMADVGEYETKYILSIDSNTLNLDGPLTNGYDGTTQDIVVQRVPNFNNLTICGGNTGGGCTAAAIVTPSAWATNTGGVLFIRANGTISINSGATLYALNYGYTGGTTTVSIGTAWNGAGGESYCGLGGGSNTNNPGDSGSAGAGSNGTGGNGYCGGGGGNGGTGSASSGGAGGGGAPAGAGGGAGYGGGGSGGIGTSSHNGGNGGTNSSGNGGIAAGGAGGGGGTYGAADLSKLYLGSGGGSGGGNHNYSTCPGNGGRGGGIISLIADTITVAGSMTAGGGGGSNYSNNGCGGGGGGAGGSIKLLGNTVTLGTNLVTAAGGGGGTGWNSLSGGSGAVGRIAVGGSSVSGSTSPSYTAISAPD